jgi:argininosuccinate synthase
MKKVLLAFSGGLDTSFCIPYLQEKGFSVITATINTGGFSPEELFHIKKRSEELGAIKHHEIDAQEKLYHQFAKYIIMANYQKGGVYPACVGPERNIIAEVIADIAKKESVNDIAHGSTGAGNDQIRFDLALQALIPNGNIIAPIREHGYTREEESKFLQKKGFSVSKEIKEYSINVGLLGTTIGGKETYDTKEEIPDAVFPNVNSINDTPEKPEKVQIEFEKGLPVCLNTQKMDGVQIIQALQHIGAKNGFGKDYHIGTTIIGTKARIGFEAPALKILIKAHSELEKIILTSKQIFWKNHLGNLYGDMVHEGLSCDPLIKNLEAFFDSANKHVSGTVELSVHKGNLTISSLQSPFSLLGKDGTYGELTGEWDGKDAEGFCKLYGRESVHAFISHSHNAS